MIATRQKPSWKLLLMVLVCVLILIDRVFTLQVIRTWLSPVVSSIITNVAVVQNQLTELFVHRVTFFSSYQERLRLEQENQILKSELEQLRYIQQDYQVLQKQLELTTREISSSEIFARVFGQAETFLIDKGTQQGIQVGNFVFFNGNLIGRVKTAEVSFSRVALLGSPEFTVLAQTTKGLVGVVSRQHQGIKVTHIESDQPIETGEAWFTAGDPELQIPRGLLIGKTTETEQKVGQPTVSVKLDTGEMKSGALVKIRRNDPS